MHVNGTSTQLILISVALVYAKIHPPQNRSFDARTESENFPKITLK